MFKISVLILLRALRAEELIKFCRNSEIYHNLSSSLDYLSNQIT